VAHLSVRTSPLGQALTPGGARRDRTCGRGAAVSAILDHLLGHSKPVNQTAGPWPLQLEARATPSPIFSFDFEYAQLKSIEPFESSIEGHELVIE
jgi:hypothetical protein